MSMSDPLADMITRIRNGQAAGKPEVRMPSSKLKIAVCKVLKSEGYIEDYRSTSDPVKAELVVVLKYRRGVPVIKELLRVSKAGRREYRTKDCLPVVLGGFGEAILSTSQGVMTARLAKKLGHGGEVLCTVS